MVPASALLLTALLAGTACAAFALQDPLADPVAGTSWQAQPPRLIAHGGGALGAVHVTNSRQALDHAAAEDFLLIEVDLCWTTDGQLVLLHDWDGAFEAMFGLPSGPRSLDDFLELDATRGLQQLDLDGLAEWMSAHPHVGIVTDIKTDWLRGLDLLAERLAPVRDQLVPQVHGLEEAQAARALGFDTIILTLYASPLSDDEVLELAAREPFYAVTFPRERALGGLAARLAALGVTTFAHTVNNQLLATRLAHAGVHGVYTDRLTPARGLRDAQLGQDDWVIETDNGGVVPGGRCALLLDLANSLDRNCGTLSVQRIGVSTGSETETVSLEAYGADGVRQRVVEVVPDAEHVPLAAIFPDELPAWIAAPAGVLLELRWDILDRPALVRRSTVHVPSVWRAGGPTGELGGLAVLLLNPGTEARTLSLSVERTGAGSPKMVSRRVPPGAVLEELIPLQESAGEVRLSVQGGGVIVQLLRATPECSLVR